MTETTVDLTNQAVDLLTRKLVDGLTHPDYPEATMPLPGLAGRGIPPEMAKHFAEEAGLPTDNAPRLMAEAIVHVLTTQLAGGSTLIPNAELEELRQNAADAPDQARIVPVPCSCGKPLVELTLDRAGRVTAPGSATLRALGIACPHGGVK